MASLPEDRHLNLKTWQKTVFMSSIMPALLGWINPYGALSILSFKRTLENTATPQSYAFVGSETGDVSPDRLSHKRNITKRKVVPEFCVDQEINTVLLTRNLQKYGIWQNKWQGSISSGIVGRSSGSESPMSTKTCADARNWAVTSGETKTSALDYLLWASQHRHISLFSCCSLLQTPWCQLPPVQAPKSTSDHHCPFLGCRFLSLVMGALLSILNSLA